MSRLSISPLFSGSLARSGILACATKFLATSMKGNKIMSGQLMAILTVGSFGRFARSCCNAIRAPFGLIKSLLTNYILERKTSRNSVINRLSLYPVFVGEFSPSIDNPVYGDVHRIPSVHLLLAHSGPATIGRLVTQVYIDTIKRMKFRGSGSHVGVKVVKVVPSWADFYASAAVMMEVLVVRICAPSLHVSPCGIDGVLIGFEHIKSPAPGDIND